MTDLRDKVVVITGAGSGIGRATALAFAARGARVAACSLHQDKVESLADALGERALLLRRVDVTARTEMQAFADDVHALAPAADILVNNAGVAVGGSFIDTSLDDWKWLLDVNLFGVIHGCHYFVPRMIERGAGGHVVNVSSIFGIFPAPSSAAYVTSKFAVRGLSLSLRAELAPHGIGVTALCPGLIATSIIEHGRFVGDMGTRRDALADAFRRGASPDRVAHAIFEVIRTNPAVRTVGVDARVLAALSRIAPRTLDRFSASLSHWFGLGPSLVPGRRHEAAHA